MDVEILYLAFRVAAVIAHTGKVPMLRLPLGLGFAFVTGRIAADLFVAGRDKGRCSVAIVDRLPATAVGRID